MIRRILLSLPLWLAYAGAELVLDTLGLFVVGALAYSGSQSWMARASKIWPQKLVVAWRGKWLTWLWGNEEDGVVGPSWWAQRHPTWSGRRQSFVWSALRNPSNNVRFIPGVNPVIDPKRVKFLVKHFGETDITLTWQGAFSGLLIVFPFRGGLWRFWLGWKLKPEDVAGVPDTDMRKPRCGFATQFKRIS